MNGHVGTVQRIVGRPPINPVAFAIGKLAIVPPHVFVVLWLAGAQFGARWPLPVRLLAAVLAAGGIALMLVSIRHLGRSTRIGLPEESTELRTNGLYRFSRNPIYLGLFLTAFGSCLLAPHWANLVSSVVMIVVHHRIVLAEERFLEHRFGPAWLEYRAAVRRYVTASLILGF